MDWVVACSAYVVDLRALFSSLVNAWPFQGVHVRTWQGCSSHIHLQLMKTIHLLKDAVLVRKYM